MGMGMPILFDGVACPCMTDYIAGQYMRGGQRFVHDVGDTQVCTHVKKTRLQVAHDNSTVYQAHRASCYAGRHHRDELRVGLHLCEECSVLDTLDVAFRRDDDHAAHVWHQLLRGCNFCKILLRYHSSALASKLVCDLFCLPTHHIFDAVLHKKLRVRISGCCAELLSITQLCQTFSVVYAGLMQCSV